MRKMQSQLFCRSLDLIKPDFAAAFSIYVILVLSPVYRSLNCGRIKMHKNLFISLACNNICWILWYTCVLFKPNVWKENSVSARR